MMRINSFPGDLTNISAKSESLEGIPAESLSDDEITCSEEAPGFCRVFHHFLHWDALVYEVVPVRESPTSNRAVSTGYSGLAGPRNVSSQRLNLSRIGCLRSDFYYDCVFDSLSLQQTQSVIATVIFDRYGSVKLYKQKSKYTNLTYHL